MEQLSPQLGSKCGIFFKLWFWRVGQAKLGGCGVWLSCRVCLGGGWLCDWVEGVMAGRSWASCVAWL